MRRSISAKVLDSPLVSVGAHNVYYVKSHQNGDSKTVIVDEITRNAQFPLKARAITVNGNASQGTIEALINVIYTWQ